MGKKDPILLDRIDQLERELADSKKLVRKLSGPSRIFEPFKDIGRWLTANDERVGTLIGVCVMSTIVLGFAWLIGGWPTGRFYVDSCPCNGSKYNVYQEYEWGWDSSIVSCGASVDKCIETAKERKADWLKYQGYKAEGLAE